MYSAVVIWYYMLADNEETQVQHQVQMKERMAAMLWDVVMRLRCPISKYNQIRLYNTVCSALPPLLACMACQSHSWPEAVFSRSGLGRDEHTS